MKVDVGINTEVGDGTNKIEKGVSRVVVCEEVKEKNGDRKKDAAVVGLRSVVFRSTSVPVAPPASSLAPSPDLHPFAAYPLRLGYLLEWLQHRHAILVTFRHPSLPSACPAFLTFGSMQDA